MITDLCQRGNHGFCWDEQCECPDCHFLCPSCHTRVKKLTDGICAPCYRRKAQATSYEGTPCDECGAKPAFRNPRGRKNKYLCVPCHVKTGDPIMIAGSAAVSVTADCMGKDAHDPAHRPVHIRGSRWQCSRCKCTLQRKAPNKTEPETRRQRAGLKGGKR
jgi:hypothetical protein